MHAQTPCLPGGVVCTLDGVDFVITLPAVRTAQPLANLPPPLPRRAGACVGLVWLEGCGIPLLDLRSWLQWPSAERTCPGDPQVALILHLQERQVAIKIDATKAVLREPLALTPLTQRGASDEELFLACANVPAMGALPVMDEQRLFALCEIWQQSSHSEQDAAIASSPTAAGSDQGQILLARLRIGTRHYCVPSTDIVAVDVMPDISAIALQSALRGYTNWRGRQLPVLPPTLLGADGDASTPYLAVVQHGSTWAGVPVTATEGMHAGDLSCLRSALESGLPASAMIRGLLARPDGGNMTLLDTAGLTSFCPLGSDTAPATQSLVTGQLKGPATSAHMIVRGLHDWALPMEEVLHVVALSAELEWQHGVSENGQPWSVAHIVHDGRSLAVWNIDQRVLDGQALDQQMRAGHPGHSIVILKTGQSEAGVVFDTPQKIVAASACRRISMQGQAGKRMHLVLTREEASHTERTYPRWDYREQLAHLMSLTAAAETVR